MDDPEDDGNQVLEAHICDNCGKIHAGEECGADLLDGDQFIIEFEQLPPDEHIQKLRKTIQQLRDERWQAMAAAQRYKRKSNLLSSGIIHIQEEVKRQKFAFGKLKSFADQNQRLLSSEYKVLAGLVKDAVNHVAGLEKCDGSCVHVKQQYQKLCVDHEALKASERSLQENIMSLEVKVQEKSKEADTMTLHAKNRDISSDQKLTKMQKDFVQRETELKTLKKDLLVLQHKMEEEQENTAAALRQAQQHSDECERLQGQVKDRQDKADVELLEKEKLQEKIKDLQSQVQKVKAGIKEKVDSEMLKMMKDMDQYQGTLEKRLQQDVEKEKEKMRKELEDYIVEYRDNQTKMMKANRTQAEKYKEMIADLQQQLETLGLEAEQREQLLQAQIQQLNNKFKHMGSRAGSRKPSVTPISGDINGQLRQKDEIITSLHAEVDDLNDQISELKAQLEQALKENKKLPKIGELESLVQKEVEERTNLVESYNKLKEELTLLRMQEIQRVEKPDVPVYTGIGPLTIHQKPSLDKYGAYRASESSGYDLSELSSQGTKSAYQRLMDLRNDNFTKSAKFSKSHKSIERIGEKSSKSGRSLQQSDVKSGSTQRQNQDAFMSQLAAKSSKSDRNPYEIASQALQRTAKTNRSHQEFTRDRERQQQQNKPTDILTKYNSLNQMNESLNEGMSNKGTKPLVPPINPVSSRMDRNEQQIDKSARSHDTYDRLLSQRVLSPNMSHSNVRENVLPKPKPFLESPIERSAVKEIQPNNLQTNSQSSDSPKMELNGFTNNQPSHPKKVTIFNGKDLVLNQGSHPQNYANNDLVHSNHQPHGIIADSAISPVDQDNQKLVKKTPLEYDIVPKLNGDNTKGAAADLVQKRPALNLIPEINGTTKQPDKKVAFKDKPQNQSNLTWKAKSMVPPVGKSKGNWKPSFENAGRTSSQSTTPNVYSNHPLHNPSTDSMASLSNMSTPSLYGNSYQGTTGMPPKRGNAVDMSRGNLMKALNERKGTASNSAWKIYQQLRTSRM